MLEDFAANQAKKKGGSLNQKKIPKWKISDVKNKVQNILTRLLYITKPTEKFRHKCMWSP